MMFFSELFEQFVTFGKKATSNLLVVVGKKMHGTIIIFICCLEDNGPRRTFFAQYIDKTIPIHLKRKRFIENDEG